GNLDSRSAHIVMEELKEIHEEGNTIIMVTHNPNLTTYATRVINMLDGRIDTDIKTVADGDLPQPVSVRIGKRKRGKKEKVQENSEDENAGEEIMVTETGRVVDGEKMEVEDLGKFDNLGDLGESKKAEELKESKSENEPKESGEVKETEDSGEAKKKEKKKEKA
ncbi:MAG: hypothetical protein Q4F60_03485, partial [Candidatus Saccharibacteria bacterium]|nr:hypothetical protein [Candidatus Saccharibacteria bacterium]